MMKKLNTIMSNEEQSELANDYDFLFHPRHETRKPGDLPEYLRKAMEKAGVVRNAEGKFVKIG